MSHWKCSLVVNGQQFSYHEPTPSEEHKVPSLYPIIYTDYRHPQNACFDYYNVKAAIQSMINLLALIVLAYSDDIPQEI